MKNNFVNSNDLELIKLIKARNKHESEAFEVIYDRYSNKLYTYCCSIFGNDTMIAQDIFQDTWEKFYDFIRNNEFQNINLCNFLIKIAKNLSINYKINKSNNNLKLDDELISTQKLFYETKYEENELAEILQLGLDMLPDDYKEVVIMKDLMDLSYKEIALNLNITLAMVRMRISRGRQKLREVLEKYVKDYNIKKING